MVVKYVSAACPNRFCKRLRRRDRRRLPGAGRGAAAEVALGGLRERPIFDYSLAVARGWKIGSKAQDNPSALLLVAIDDRKYFTQVSKDLEDELPDGVVGNLQRQYLVPEFKKGNYGKGISDTIDAYIATIRNKGNAPVAGNTNTSRPVSGSRSGQGTA